MDDKKLSDKTLAEQEAGRKSLEARTPAIPQPATVPPPPEPRKKKS